MTEWLLIISGIAIGFTIGWFTARRLGAQSGLGLAYKARLEMLENDKRELNETLERTRSELTEFRERAVRLQAQEEALRQRLKEQPEQVKAMATALFDEYSNKFSLHSEKKIDDLLDPLRNRLNDFQKLVTDSFTAQGKEQYSLKAEIEKIVLQTDSLTKALRGDVKAQGNWGEVMLERILEESGLRKGEDYILQGESLGLADAEGGRLRPDVVIKLPDNKHIIIDAKVSLTAYERYCGEAVEAHLKDFLKSVRSHVAGLESKRYQDNEKLGTPDFVLLFMPIEGAFSLAMQQDRELHHYAWSRRIVIVSPTMLFANLRTIASLWRIERQNRYAQDIAHQGGALYDKFVGFVEDMQGIGRQMGVLQKSYDSAMNKLTEGRGNLISSIEKLKTLGAKASKSLPKELVADHKWEDAPRLAAAEG